MVKSAQLLYLCLFILISCLSCKKKNTESPSTNNAALLCKVDYISAGAGDTLVYTYVGSRIDSISWYVSNILLETYKYSYNENGDVLKIIIKNPGFAYDITYDYVYSNQLLTSVKGSNGKVITIAYGSDNYPTSITTNNTSSEKQFSNMVFENGNLKSYTMTYEDVDEGSLNLSATYDDKKNFGKYNIPLNTLDLLEYFNKNNLVSSSLTTAAAVTISLGSGYTIPVGTKYIDRTNFQYNSSNNAIGYETNPTPPLDFTAKKTYRADYISCP